MCFRRRQLKGGEDKDALTALTAVVSGVVSSSLSFGWVDFLSSSTSSPFLTIPVLLPPVPFSPLFVPSSSLSPPLRPFLPPPFIPPPFSCQYVRMKSCSYISLCREFLGPLIGGSLTNLFSFTTSTLLVGEVLLAMVRKWLYHIM